MKAVIQRVKKAKVLINNLEERKIDFGLVVLLGIVIMKKMLIGS